jgi:hypothetical protein
MRAMRKAAGGRELLMRAALCIYWRWEGKSGEVEWRERENGRKQKRAKRRVQYKKGSVGLSVWGPTTSSVHGGHVALWELWWG